MRLNFRYSLNKHLLFQRANANTERERERGRAWNMTKYQHHFFDWPFVCFDFISHFVPCIFSLMHDSSFSYADRYSELFCTYDIVFSCIFFCFFFSLCSAFVPYYCCGCWIAIYLYLVNKTKLFNLFKFIRLTLHSVRSRQHDDPSDFSFALLKCIVFDLLLNS